MVELQSRSDERRNPLSSGRTDRNWSEVFRKHKLEESMIRHVDNHSESWKTLPWKQFRRNLFRLQRRVFKAIQVGDKRKAKSLQKLILKVDCIWFKSPTRERSVCGVGERRSVSGYSGPCSRCLFGGSLPHT